MDVYGLTCNMQILRTWDGYGRPFIFGGCMTYAEIRRSVMANHSDTATAQAFRKALNIPTLYVDERPRKRRHRKDRRAIRELMANKWGAAERHGKG